MGQKTPAKTGSEAPTANQKRPRTNARTWRKDAIQIVSVHRTANGATRAEMVATTTPQTVAAVVRAIRNETPTTTKLYAIHPRGGHAATIPEALREAVAAWSDGDPTGMSGRMEAKNSRKRR